MTTRSYAIRLEAEYQAFVRGMDLAAKATDKVADAAEKAGQRVDRAQKAQADAAGRLRVAEQQLADARTRHGAQSTQAVAAEERVAKARRDVDKATKEVTAAEAAHRASMEQTSAAAAQQQTALGRLTTSVEQNRESWDRAGMALSAFGAITTATAGATVKAAVDWESAWTGVLKTVEGTPQQLAAVEAGLRGMARELPSSHTEIAAVAEAAGQLGISTGGIVQFTRTMIDLGETTNLSAEEAAMALAKFAAVMGTSESDIGRLGASVVGLGNNFATTEADIVAMSTRLSAAGAVAGFTEPQVLGLAAAMSSIGIEAEAGGTAMSQTIQTISKAVVEGSGDLQGFADLAGMSAERFASTWRSNPIVALDAVIGGLDAMNKAGGNTYGTLKDLNIAGIRQVGMLQGLATATGMATRAVGLANEEWEANTALVDEAGKRYDTAEAKMQIAKNAITDSAITVGQAFLPALAAGADAVAGLAEAFGALPAPMQQAIGGMTGLVGVTSLLAGGFLLTFPRVIETARAMRDIGAISPGTVDKLRRFGPALGALAKALGVAAAAFTAAQIAAAAFGEESDPRSAAEWTRILLDVSDAAELAAVQIKGIAGDSYNLREAFERVTDPGIMDRFDDFAGNLLGMNSSADLVTDELERMGQALASMYASDPAMATAKFQAYLDLTGASTAQLLELMPSFRDVLLEAENAQDMASQSASDLAEGMDGVGASANLSSDALDELAKRVQKTRESYDEASRSFINISGTYTEMLSAQQAKQEETAKKTAKSKGQEGDAWKKFVGDVKVSLSDYLAELDRQVQAQQNWQSNLMRLTDSLSASTIGYLQSLGPEAAGLVEQLTTASVEELARFDALTQETLAGASSEWVLEMERGMALVTAVMQSQGPEAAAALADSLAQGLRDGSTTVEAEAARLGATITEQVPGEWPVTFTGNTAEAEGAARGLRTTIEQEAGHVKPWTIAADATLAHQTLARLTSDIGAAKGTVEIEGHSGSAERVLYGLTAQVDQASGTVTIYGSDGEARTTLSNYKHAVDSTTGAVTITGEDSKGRAVTVRLTDWVSKQGGAIVVSARDNATPTIEAIKASLAGLSRTVTVGVNGTVSVGTSGLGGRQTFATGGYTGPGGKHEPAGIVHRDEYVVRKESRQSIERVAPGFLDALNERGADALGLGGYAGGGRVSATSRQYETQRDRAQAEMQRLWPQIQAAATRGDEDRKRSLDERFWAAEKRYNDAVAQLQAFAKDRAAYERTLSRGDILGQATGGLSSAQSLVDRLRTLDQDESLAYSSRVSLARMGEQAEKSFSRLYGTLTHVTDQLDAAKQRAAELQQISDRTASSLIGGFSLDSASGRDPWSGRPTGAGILASARDYASKVKSLSSKVGQLVSRGFAPAIVQEVGQAGVQGGLAMADALLSMSAAEVRALNGQYASIEQYAALTGQNVTSAFSKGGLSAANAQVIDLTRQQAQVEAQIAGVGKQIENLLAGVFGLPRRAKGGPTQAGQAYIVGEEGPELHVPRTSGYVLPADVTRSLAYASPAAGAGGGVTAVQVALDKGALAQAMAGTELTLLVDGQPMRAVVHAEMKQAADEAALAVGARRQ
ncbi:phage tail tape measure protein [Xylanimonas oleitrophica]|uniref:Phage tail tape measure protein n=1 Tax=Xylanimonas oleitrophica TaxID=2607479 RepID=A0A2W5WVN1_9MICO|nr:phage tail tape measure protein [Xylanimonas oleitrophica]PZR55220.1 phage tail tape measure protein [Xylanimonas oleitrophica]